MSRRAGCLAVAVLAAAAVQAARDAAALSAVALPALARVTADEPSGETWRQVGELGGSVATARGECAAALAAAGQDDRAGTLARAVGVDALDSGISPGPVHGVGKRGGHMRLRLG